MVTYRDNKPVSFRQAGPIHSGYYKSSL